MGARPQSATAQQKVVSSNSAVSPLDRVGPSLPPTAFCACDHWVCAKWYTGTKLKSSCLLTMRKAVANLMENSIQNRVEFP
jgi:hypothetical protein